MRLCSRIHFFVMIGLLLSGLSCLSSEAKAQFGSKPTATEDEEPEGPTSYPQ